LREYAQGDGGKRAVHRGEHAINKPVNHCAGKAGVFPLNLYARVRFLLRELARETAGAARTQSSLRPLNFRGPRLITTRAQCAPREFFCCLKIEPKI
jgi:hypothetical protein